MLVCRLISGKPNKCPELNYTAIQCVSSFRVVYISEQLHEDLYKGFIVGL